MLSVQPILFDARVQKEACALRDSGCEVSIIYVEDPRALRGLPHAEEAWTRFRDGMSGISTIPLVLRSREWRAPKPVRMLAQAVELFWKLGRAVLRRHYDVYHCHDLTPGLFGIFGKQLHRARIVYDAHELEVRAPNPLHRAVQAVYERVVVACSDAVITVNEPIASLMRAKYRRSITVIGNRPHYIDRRALEPHRLRAIAGLPPEARIILYVGFLVRELRGIETVIRALPRLQPDIHFLIMGVGRLEEFKDYVYEYSDRHSVPQERVRFVGPVAPRDVVHYLHGADVSLALYQGEAGNSELNAPNKLFQSIMARTPILAANNTTLPKFVRDNGVGPVGEVADPADPREVADRIRLMMNPDHQQMYRRNADALAQQFSWERESKKLVGVYAST